MSIILLKLHRFRHTVLRNAYNFLQTRENHDATFGSNDIPIVSLVDIKRQLRLNGYIPEDGFTCLISKCPDCKKKGKEPGNVYINKTTGFFLCSCCERNGQWMSLEKIIKGKSKDSKISSQTDGSTSYHKEFKTRWQEIVTSTQSVADLTQEEMETVLKKFDFPIFSDANKVLKDVRVGNDRLVFPIKDISGSVCGAKHILHRPKEEEVNLEEQCEGGGGVVIVGGVIGGSTKGATLVPTVGDALALASSKHSGAIICPPQGFSSLPQEVLPILEGYTRLVLWGSSDHSDNTLAVARKLSHVRCLLVRCLEYQGGALFALKQGADIRTLLSQARPIWHKSITSFSSLREDVLSDLHNIDKVRGVKWKRFPSLNKLIQGHRRGELTILTGPTGSGKTTFCSEYSLDLAMQGVNTLWGSFEIRNSRLARTMLQQFAGIPLEENLKEFDRFANEFEKLPIHFLMFHGQQTIKDVMEAVEHAFYIHDIAHVVIDNVQFMLGIGEESSHRVDRFWRQDAVITAFRTFATRRNCHVSLVMHPRKEKEVDDLSTNSIFGSAKASQEADNVLIIQDKRLTAVRGKKYLQVAKNRYCGDLGIVPLEFDKAALSYAQKKKDQSQKSKEQSPPQSLDQNINT